MLYHPHIVGVHDRGEFHGQLWISMDYVDGTDTAQLLRKRYPAGAVPETTCCSVTRMAARENDSSVSAQPLGA